MKNVAKVKIYRVKGYNINTDKFVLSRHMATRERAASMKGEILEDTEVTIDKSRLEPGEEWTPIDFKF
jgi:hypothetical protein